MRCSTFFVAYIISLYIKDVISSNGECQDLNGRTISQDMHYVPGPDSCTLCICDNGHPKWCKAVLCSPPQDCKSFRVGKSCCEFICLDDALTKGEGIIDLGADFGLRLVVSAVAAVLSLCLLFFLVHRLRQRKIRGRQNRQLHEDERSLASIGYITGSLGYFGSHGGRDRHLELHYEEQPTHLSLWKPSGNYFPRGEAPPPYEEALQHPMMTASNTLPNISHRTIPLNLTTTGTIRVVNTARQPPGGEQGTVCIVDNTNTVLRHSNCSLLSDVNANTLLRHAVSLPRQKNTLVKGELSAPRSEVSTLRYEININASPEGLCSSVRPCKREDISFHGIADVVALPPDMQPMPLEDIPPPLDLTPDGQDDSSIITSDMLYEDVALMSASPTHPASNDKDVSEATLEATMDVDVDEMTTAQDDPPSSCDCSSLQCLTNDDNDDYRSECENCKSGHGSSYFLDEESEPPETMTLQRQTTKDADEFEGCRTSLTLPTHCRRPTRGISGARENWFSSMPETGSSSEEDEED